MENHYIISEYWQVFKVFVQENIVLIPLSDILGLRQALHFIFEASESCGTKQQYRTQNINIE